MQNNTNNSNDRKAYIFTGPTSGIGLTTTLELARRGTIVLVGRNEVKLDDLRKAIEQKGGHAVSVVCDLSDATNVRRAAAKSSHCIFRSPVFSTMRASRRCVQLRTRWDGTCRS